MIVSRAGDLYIADAGNNRIQEVPLGQGVQWGQQMTGGDIYTVAGSAAGTQGDSLGGPATGPTMNGPETMAIDPSGNMYIPDSESNLIDEVISATSTAAFALSPAPGSGTPAGVTITQEDGSQVTFYPVGSGCFLPYSLVPSGQYCALPEDAGANLSFSSGTYTFSPQPGNSYLYNSAGQLSGVTDEVTNEKLSITYGMVLPGQQNCPSTASWCEVATSVSGRTLTLGYNSSSLITSVTDPMGRRWNYSYAGSDLTSATDPIGNTTTYTYGAGSSGNPLNANDMLTITNPNGQSTGTYPGAHTTLVYDSTGRATSQSDPMGNTTTFTWTGYDPATGNGFINVLDPDGNKTVYFYIQGALGAQSEWTGSTLTSEDDFVPDQTTGTQLDSAEEDANGNIATATFNSDGSLATTTAPDGQSNSDGSDQVAETTQVSTALKLPICSSDMTASATCQQDSGPGSQSVAPGQAITPPPQIPPEGVAWTLYDNYGNDLYTTVGVYEPGASTPVYAQTVYTLFNGNTVTLPGTTTQIACAQPAPSPMLPCASINADGVVSQFGYNSAGDLTSTSTPDGNGTDLSTTTFSFDGDGEQTSTVSPDGNVSGATPSTVANYTTTTAYNADGQQTSVTQGGTGGTVTPRTVSYGYDGDSNQTAVTDARGYTTNTAYNADDEASLVTDPDLNATLTCYDGDGNPAQTVPAIGVAANHLGLSSCPTSYPAAYNPATSGNWLAPDATLASYNGLGQQTAQYAPLPNGQTGPPNYETTSYSYDADGNLVQTAAPSSITGGSSETTTSTYDQAGELTEQTTGTGSAASTISYCYDSAGDVTSIVYPDGNALGGGPAPCEQAFPWIVDPTKYPTQAEYQTTYGYDSVQQLVSVTRPAPTTGSTGGTSTYTYDPAGNELTSTDPNGVTSTMTYNPGKAIASTSYSGSAAHQVTYSYDADGNPTGMTDATGSSSYSNDPFGELTSSTNGAGQTVSYSYDANGNTTGITYPLPASATWATTDAVSYNYDHAGMLTSLTDFSGHSIGISTNADGLPTSATLGSTGDTITTSYDNVDNPSNISLKRGASTLQAFGYSFGPASTILNETDTPSSAQTPTVYTYDNRGRVLSMTPGTGAQLTYGFDATGGLTTLPSGSTGQYDRAGEFDYQHSRQRSDELRLRRGR